MHHELPPLFLYRCSKAQLFIIFVQKSVGEGTLWTPYDIEGLWCLPQNATCYNLDFSIIHKLRDPGLLLC